DHGAILTAAAGRGSARCRVPADPVQQKREEPIGEDVRVAAGMEPRVGPVRGREEEQDGGAVVEVGAQLAELAAFAEEVAHALLVAAPLGDKRIATVA